MNSESLRNLRRYLSGKSRVVILSHANPDGDAVGSVLAMYGYLNKRMSEEPEIVLPDQTPDFYQWMKFSSKIVDAEQKKQQAEQLIQQADVLFCLDFNALKRVQKLEEVLRNAQAYKILIDHHPEPEPSFDWILSDTGVSSTAELVYRFMKDLDDLQYIDHQIAEALYTGIMTDTGSFNFNASHPYMYEVLKHLVETGIDPGYIHHQVYDTFSESRMRLIGHSLLNKMVVLPEYRTAYIALSRQELDSFQYQKGDTEGLVNYPLGIKGIVFAALFVEQQDLIKISFRSKGTFPVNGFARDYFKGGGHKNAAGGKSYVSLQDTIESFETFVKQYKNNLTNATI